MYSYRVFLSQAQRKGIVGKVEGKRLRSDSNIVGKVVKEGKRLCGDDDSDSDSDSDSVELGSVLARHRVV